MFIVEYLGIHEVSPYGFTLFTLYFFLLTRLRPRGRCTSPGRAWAAVKSVHIVTF